MAHCFHKDRSEFEDYFFTQAFVFASHFMPLTFLQAAFELLREASILLIIAAGLSTSETPQNTRNDGIDLDYQLLKRVMSAGVRLYIEVYQPRSTFTIHCRDVLYFTRRVILGQLISGNMNKTGVING